MATEPAVKDELKEVRDELEKLKKDIDAGKLKAREDDEYLKNWALRMMPVRTLCYRCRRDSPIVFIVEPGDAPEICFGGHPTRGRTDITGPLVEEFSKLGWSFQKRRSYCPTCKGQGV